MDNASLNSHPTDAPEAPEAADAAGQAGQADPVAELRLDQDLVQIVGEGVLDRELAVSFEHLGFRVVVAPEDVGLFPALVVAGEGTDPAVVRVIGQRTGARLAPSVEACALTRGRAGVRRVATEELGLPTMEYEFVDSLEAAEAAAQRIGLPVVVKPGRSLEGEGQSVVRLLDDVAAAWERAAVEGVPVTVERFIDFDFEVTVLTARSVDPVTGELATWFCEPIGTRHEAGKLVEAWQPALLSEAAADSVRSIAARITGAIACQGLYSIELFVAGDDVYFSQVSPRPGFDGLLTRATQRINQFDLHARAVLGLPIDVTLVSPGAARFVEVVRPGAERIAAAMAVEETGVRVVGEQVVVTSTGESAQEARDRASVAVSRLV